VAAHENILTDVITTYGVPEGATRMALTSTLRYVAAVARDEDAAAAVEEFDQTLARQFEARMYKTAAGASFCVTWQVSDETAAARALRTHVPPLPGAADTTYNGIPIATGLIGRPVYFAVGRRIAIVASDLNDARARLDEAAIGAPAGGNSREGVRIAARVLPAHLAALFETAGPDASETGDVTWGRVARAIDLAALEWRASRTEETIAIALQWAS
jgi:hypothetical protein